jgi:hypothetical protein
MRKTLGVHSPSSGSLAVRHLRFPSPTRDVHVEAEGRLHIGAMATDEALVRAMLTSCRGDVPMRITTNELVDTFELMFRITRWALAAGAAARFELIGRERFDVFVIRHATDIEPSARTSSGANATGVTTAHSG